MFDPSDGRPASPIDTGADIHWVADQRQAKSLFAKEFDRNIPNIWASRVLPDPVQNATDHLQVLNRVPENTVVYRGVEDYRAEHTNDAWADALPNRYREQALPYVVRTPDGYAVFAEEANGSPRPVDYVVHEYLREVLEVHGLGSLVSVAQRQALVKTVKDNYGTVAELFGHDLDTDQGKLNAMEDYLSVTAAGFLNNTTASAQPPPALAAALKHLRPAVVETSTERPWSDRELLGLLVRNHDRVDERQREEVEVKNSADAIREARIVNGQPVRTYRSGSVQKRIGTPAGTFAAKAYHTPTERTAGLYARAQIVPESFYELTEERTSAATFRRAMELAQAKLPTGAFVHKYETKEYQAMRLFLSPDAKTGLAIKDNGDIVSVFNTAGRRKGNAAVTMAISQGGNRLDTYGGFLPGMYARHGFRAVARTKFMDKYAPEGWDFDKFGRPDNVFMVLDPTSANTEYNSEGETVAYENAESVQRAALEETEFGEAPAILLSRKARVVAENADPESELARLLKVTGIRQASQSVPEAPFLVKAMEGLSDVALKGVLINAPRRLLKDFLPRELAPNLHQYIDTFSHMAGDIAYYQHQYDQVTKKWVKWYRTDPKRGDRLAEIMQTATYLQADPGLDQEAFSEQIKGLKLQDRRLKAKQYQDLRSSLEKLGPEAMDIYLTARDSYVDMRERNEFILKQRIDFIQEATDDTKKTLLNRIRKELEQNNLPGPYFPFTRYGNNWAAAKVKGGKTHAAAHFETR